MAIDESTWRRLMPQPMTEARRRIAIAQDRAGGVIEPCSVAALHTQQRNFEPPKGYSIALAKMGQPATTPRRRAAGEVPRPWTEDIAARRASGALPTPTVAHSDGGAEPPRGWTLGLAARRAAEAAR